MTIKELKRLILKWEGGNGSKGRDPKDNASKNPCPTKFVDPKDGIMKGGWHTVEGVIYSTWVGVFGKNQDQRWWDMSDEDWFKIFSEKFLNKVGGEKIKSLNVLAVVADIAFMSHPKTAVINLQRAVNSLGKHSLVVDGVIGPNTINATNECDPKELIKSIVLHRIVFLNKIVEKNPTQKRFIKGWSNRTNDYLKSYSVGL